MDDIHEKQPTMVGEVQAEGVVCTAALRKKVTNK